MTGRLSKVFLLLILVSTLSLNLVSPVSYAQGPGESGDEPAAPQKPAALAANNPVTPFTAAGSALSATDATDLPFNTSAKSGTVTAIIWLEGDPAAAASAAYTNPNSVSANYAAEARAAAVRAQQSAFRAELVAQFDVEMVGRTTNLTNALIVNMDASQIDDVRQMPGVKDVFADQVGYLDNGNSVPFIGAPTAWTAGTGYTGAGMRIGIIDSGIDYTHANFGGSGDPADFSTNNDTSQIEDDISGDAVGFGNSKIIGGYDFVGDAWASGDPLVVSGNTTPRLNEGTGWDGSFYDANGDPSTSATNPFNTGDNDPLDCNGHGSHVAGTAAGFGVDGGATYAGLYDTLTDYSTFDIGPGVAPEAQLFAFKIGACSSSVSFAGALLAIDMVMDPNGDGDLSDRLDVVNNSYGGAYGSPAEMLVQAFDYASANGVVMVASAGNEGDTYFVNGDPGIAASAITVASSVADTIYAGLELTTGLDATYAPYPHTIAANPSVSGAPGSFGPMNLRLVAATGGGNSQGCAVADYAGFAGEAGVIIWDDTAAGCGSADRMTNAVLAGTVGGLVVVSADPGDFPFINLSCADNNSPTGESSIPCVSITATDGTNIVSDITNFTVTFDDTLSAPLSVSIGDMLSGFSSRGPSSAIGGDTIRLKPDVAAPGQSIQSTGIGTGTGSDTMSGTSMASPHVTGMVALLRQQHPSWSVAQIKALVMNTATNDLWTEAGQTGDNYGVSRVGAGRVDLRTAVNSDVIAYNNAHPDEVSISYGLVEVVDTVTLNQTVTVSNLGSTAQSYNVSFQQMNDMNGVEISVSPSSITVAGGSTQSVTVTLTADKSQMALSHLPDPTISLTQSGAFGSLPRNWLSEEGGYVVLEATTATADLRVPVHAIVRPAADMSAGGELALPATDAPGSVLLPLSGNDVFTGINFPFDTISEVSAFELVYENDVPLGDFRESAHIRYIGITSDYPAALVFCAGDVDCAIANTTIYVGIATHDNWNAASGFDTWFDIGFDSDEDGAYDSTVFNFETGYLAGGDWTDTIMSYYTDGGSWLTGTGNVLGGYYINDISPGSLDTYVMNNRVMMFPVGATDIGLTGTNTDFQFDVLGLKNFYTTDWLPDVPPFWFTYDVAAPAYSFTDLSGAAGGPYFGAPIWDDLDGLSVPVDYDLTAYGEGPYPSILLLHHHNSTDIAAAEAIEVVLATDDPADPAAEASDEWTGTGDPGTDVTVLPSTGYAPEQTEQQSSNTLALVLAVSALALTLTIGGVVIRRRRA